MKSEPTLLLADENPRDTLALFVDIVGGGGGMESQLLSKLNGSAPLSFSMLQESSWSPCERLILVQLKAFLPMMGVVVVVVHLTTNSQKNRSA
jgi:hypothetical protein